MFSRQGRRWPTLTWKYNPTPTNNGIKKITTQNGQFVTIDYLGYQKTVTYDGSTNRVKTGTATHSYNGNGRRVKKVAGGVTTWNFYDPEGNSPWE